MTTWHSKNLYTGREPGGTNGVETLYHSKSQTTRFLNFRNPRIAQAAWNPETQCIYTMQKKNSLLKFTRACLPSVVYRGSCLQHVPSRAGNDSRHARQATHCSLTRSSHEPQTSTSSSSRSLWHEQSANTNRKQQKQQRWCAWMLSVMAVHRS